MSGVHDAASAENMECMKIRGGILPSGVVGRGFKTLLLCWSLCVPRPNPFSVRACEISLGEILMRLSLRVVLRCLNWDRPSLVVVALHEGPHTGRQQQRSVTAAETQRAAATSRLP
jgi:hypothetical protein